MSFISFKPIQVLQKVLDLYIWTNVASLVFDAENLCFETLLNVWINFPQVLEPSVREGYGNTNRWFITLINQPNFKKVIGDFKLCEKMAQFDGNIYILITKHKSYF